MQGNMIQVLKPALLLSCSFDDFLVAQTIVEQAPQVDRDSAQWLEEGLLACATANSAMTFGA